MSLRLLLEQLELVAQRNNFAGKSAKPVTFQVIRAPSESIALQTILPELGINSVPGWEIVCYAMGESKDIIYWRDGEHTPLSGLLVVPIGDLAAF